MRSQKCIYFCSAISVTDAMSKKPTIFNGDLVATWMGDHWDPRSKSGLQLKKKNFFLSTFFNFFVFLGFLIQLSTI